MFCRWGVRGHSNCYIQNVIYWCCAALLRAVCCCGGVSMLLWRRVHVSIHNEVSIRYTCWRYWRRGQGEKKDRKKPSRFFGFVFGATEKPTSKSRFSVGKNREKLTEKNDFRFSVHNPGCLTLESTRTYYCTYFAALYRAD